MNLKPILIQFLNWRDKIQVDTKSGETLLWKENEALVDQYLKEINKPRQLKIGEFECRGGFLSDGTYSKIREFDTL